MRMAAFTLATAALLAGSFSASGAELAVVNATAPLVQCGAENNSEGKCAFRFLLDKPVYVRAKFDKKKQEVILDMPEFTPKWARAVKQIPTVLCQPENTTPLGWCAARVQFGETMTVIHAQLWLPKGYSVPGIETSWQVLISPRT